MRLIYLIQKYYEVENEIIDIYLNLGPSNQCRHKQHKIVKGIFIQVILALNMKYEWYSGH